MLDLFKKLNGYFIARKTLTLVLLWVFCFIAFGYGLLSMYVFTNWNFWLLFIPGALSLYFRILYSKAAYDPQKDKRSPEYIPYKDRPSTKNKKKKKKK